MLNYLATIADLLPRNLLWNVNSKLGGMSLDIRSWGGGSLEVNLLTYRDSTVCLEDESDFCFPLNSFKRTGFQTKGNRIQLGLSVFINFQLALLPALFLQSCLRKTQDMFSILLRMIWYSFWYVLGPYWFWKCWTQILDIREGKQRIKTESLPPACSRLWREENVQVSRILSQNKTW